jgi:sulfonate transport system ATP-binding protein
MLTLDHVGKIYPNGVNALEGFAARIQLGEIVAIIGGSGCGKSTLLRAVSGLDHATQGAITLDGEAITAPHEKLASFFRSHGCCPG